ncbi:conserved regulator of innate immunity protein 3-like [Drosophila albomicans]|uniref:Conserved regulator of innate immunity protein 3-like n=1 Tax=Drosophila albomicans TaxID=7291 RepID=A0A9C6T0Y1_DROAB|nr:conserved regulator of innate immunity protein 3-like [Drosophila albomicans]
MSNFLKICKLGRSVLLTNCRLAKQMERTLAVSAMQLQHLKDEAVKQETPKDDELKTESLSPPQGLTALQRDLLELITAEIIEERRMQVPLKPPYKIDDFVGHFSGSKVELVKQSPDERINVFFNVSKSVPNRNVDNEASGGDGDVDNDGGVDCSTTVRSVPKFEVLIKRNNLMLSVFCVFKSTALEDIEPEQLQNDLFEIQDLSLYTNGWNDSCFTVDASLIDDDLQAMLVEMLEEKGITQEFARKLSDLATAREHALYIEFLENLSKFTVGLPLPIKEANN